MISRKSHEGTRLSHSWWLILVTAILTAGVLCAWWLAVRADRKMRENFLAQARLMVQTLNAERIKTLTGTQADLSSPAYLRLKEQLIAVRTAEPRYRFVYLMGRSSDGSIFFFVDSEPPESKDYSPPGQVYEKVSEKIRRVFNTRAAAVEGPVTDRWGTWFSALVPIHDPLSDRTSMASPADARALVQRAIEFAKVHGKDRLIQELNNPTGAFVRGDLYAFAYDLNATTLAHSIRPELVGVNLLDEKDWPGGEAFRRQIRDLALSEGHGWVDYEYKNLVTNAVEPKTAYLERFDDLVICAGAYKGTGNLIAVLGMDIDARDWRWAVARKSVPPVGVATLSLIIIVLFGWFFLNRRACRQGMAPRWTRHLETMLTVAAGLVLTLFGAWLAHDVDKTNQADSFRYLAETQTAALVEEFHDIEYMALEGLAGFYEGSEDVSEQEFRRYAEYLVRNRTVQAWEWVQAVPAAEKEHFEQSARAAGLDNFEIWEMDAEGNRVSATGREVYYPVFHVVPEEGNQSAIGFDLVSEPVRRAALEEALKTGFTTASNPVPLVQETGTRKGMLVFRPVFTAAEPRQPRGLAVAILRLDNTLRKVISTDVMETELILAHSDHSSETLATTWTSGTPPSEELTLRRPILVFGKAFILAAYARPKFSSIQPVRAGIGVGLTGLLLTLASAILISLLVRRREALQDLVRERTTELRESEERYRMLFADSPDAYLVLHDGIITDCNGATEAMLRGDRSRILGRSPDYFSPEFQPDGKPSADAAKDMIAEAVKKGFLNFEWVHRRFDGEEFWCDVSLSVSTQRGRPVLLALLRDITARKLAEVEKEKLQIQLLHAQKMESVGRLAGGVAHDFNNMLGAILGYVEIAMNKTDPSDPLFHYLQQIQKAAQRSADLTSQLLAFARKQTVAPKVLDLNNTVEGMLKLLRRLIGEDIDLVWLPGRKLWPVLMDPAQLDNILANLCVNARDAIEGVGKITIETDNVSLDEDYCSRHLGFVPGDYVLLSVSDSGCGMDAETLSHIFEPFFTSKEMGKGTGLGLATVYGVVNQNNGFIKVYSEPGHGTTFKIYLPRHVVGSAQDSEERKPNVAAPPPGSETILLVEDEPMILEITKTMLHELGYSVLAVRTPGEAIRLAREHSGRIDLLMTDVVMPEMNGRELAKNLVAIHPGLRRLFMSGYTANVIAHHGVLDEGVHFIQKPFSIKDLQAKIREALDSHE